MRFSWPLVCLVCVLFLAGCETEPRGNELPRTSWFQRSWARSWCSPASARVAMTTRYTAHHAQPKRLKGWIVFDHAGEGRLLADGMTAEDAQRIARLLNAEERGQEGFDDEQR